MQHSIHIALLSLLSPPQVDFHDALIADKLQTPKKDELNLQNSPPLTQMTDDQFIIFMHYSTETSQMMANATNSSISTAQ